MNCPICKRKLTKEYTEQHHLIPKSLRHEYPKLKGPKKKPICCDCHDAIHHYFSCKELAESFNSYDNMLNDERIQKWARFIKDKEFQYFIKGLNEHEHTALDIHW